MDELLKKVSKQLIKTHRLVSLDRKLFKVLKSTEFKNVTQEEFIYIVAQKMGHRESYVNTRYEISDLFKSVESGDAKLSRREIGKLISDRVENVFMSGENLMNSVTELMLKRIHRRICKRYPSIAIPSLYNVIMKAREHNHIDNPVLSEISVYGFREYKAKLYEFVKTYLQDVKFAVFVDPETGVRLDPSDVELYSPNIDEVNAVHYASMRSDSDDKKESPETSEDKDEKESLIEVNYDMFKRASNTSVDTDTGTLVEFTKTSLKKKIKNVFKKVKRSFRF